MITPSRVTINGELYDMYVAKIESTLLGIEDHGVFIATLALDYGGSGQSTSAIVLDSREVEDDYSNYKRRGTAYGHDFIMQIINTVGVDMWEQVKGKTIYALKRVDDSWGYVIGIANLYAPEKKNLVFEDHRKEFFETWPNGR